MKTQPSGQLFDSFSAELRQQRSVAHLTCRQFNQSPSKGNLKRLKSLFEQCGERVFIEYGFHCDYGNKIHLGADVYININCTLLDGGLIKIGNHTMLGPNVQLLTINHPTIGQQRLKKTSYAGDITIGENVWLGAGTIVLPGVSIGDNCVIGAGSVVTKDIAKDTLCGGNPAQRIRDLGH
jgi:maltose O-acetyltransferase